MLCFCKNKMKKVIINNRIFYECDNCGFLKKNDVPTPSLEKERYDHHICDEGYLKYMNNIFLSIKKYLNNGISLDYGCGQIHALSDIMNSNNLECDYYDLFYYPDMPKRIYDNIILIEVFEHIEDIYSLLVSLKNMLNKNGKIIILTQVKPNNLDNWWYLRDITHISFVSEKTMNILAYNLNYKVEYDKEKSLFILSSI